MYAVTGITGKVGGKVAQTLLAAGKKVRAVVRDEAKGPGPTKAVRSLSRASAMPTH
jgi:uncharacterized protein YbjT (DUF2867 family)